MRLLLLTSHESWKCRWWPNFCKAVIVMGNHVHHSLLYNFTVKRKMYILFNKQICNERHHSCCLCSVTQNALVLLIFMSEKSKEKNHCCWGLTNLAGNWKRRMSWILDSMYLFISWGRCPIDRSRFLTSMYDGLLLRRTSAAAALTFFS